jgi:hypothetical protein
MYGMGKTTVMVICMSSGKQIDSDVNEEIMYFNFGGSFVGISSGNR